MSKEDKKLKDLKVSDVKKMYVRYILFVCIAAPIMFVVLWILVSTL